MRADLAVVVIGRNEGKRLVRSLEAVGALGLPAVYVDSGSSDGSPERARQAGFSVVELDPARPFTAGRGRNEGLAFLLGRHPRLEAVQFVDGDCELVPGWIEAGLAGLRSDGRIAAICGRVRELDVRASIYNRLCDMEWDAPAGETRTCGGNVLLRVSAFQEVGGFRPGFIAGEEPELCLRLRAAGWRILRSDREMVRHDAAMTRFSQWWRRARRAGWSYAAGAATHGATPERHNVRDVRSILFWGGALPAIALGLAPWTRGLSLALLAGYLVLAARVRAHGRRRGFAPADATLLAAFTVLAKFPQFLGVCEFHLRRLAGRSRGVMDWRGA